MWEAVSKMRFVNVVSIKSICITSCPTDIVGATIEKGLGVVFQSS